MTDKAHLIRASVAILLAASLVGCGKESTESLAKSAESYLAKGNRDAAIVQLKNLLQKSPDDGAARLLLGKAYLEKQEYLLAEVELRRALELDQPADQVMPALARTMLGKGEAQKLLDQFGTVKLLDRTAIADFRASLGDAYLRTRKREEAKAQYEAALAARSDNLQARLGLARVDAVEGRDAEADRRIDALLATAPDFLDAHELKADLQLRRGERAEAKKSYQAVLAGDPRRETTNLTLAAVLIEEGDFDEAAKRLAAVRPSNANSLRLTYLEGLLAFRRGDLSKAREHVLRILGPLPEHVPTLALAGAIELEAGRFSAAEAYLQRAVSFSPRNDGARRLLVGVYTKSGQPARAKDLLDEMLAQRKTPDAQLLMLAGETYLANGDLAKAAEFFRRASSGESVKAVARTKLGQLAFASGDAETGFRELQIAAEIDPNQSQADIATIVAHLTRKESDKALAAALALEKKRPSSPQTYQMLGLVHLARKDMAAGRKSLERSVELQPNYLPSVMALVKLDMFDGRPERAKRRLEDVIANDPKNEQAYVLLAELQARTKSSPEEVSKTLQRAVQANPTSTRARLTYISSLLYMKDRKAVQAAIHDAVAAAPEDASLLEGIATIQERMGERNQALDTLKQLVAMQPQSPQPLQRVAEFHVRQREYDKALDALRRARTVAPESRELVREFATVSVAAGKFDEALREARDLQRHEPNYAGGYAIEGEVHIAARKYLEAEKAYREALRVDPHGTAIAMRMYEVLLAAGKPADAEAFVNRWTKENPRDIGFRALVAQRAAASKNFAVAATQYRAIVDAEPKNAVALNNLAWVLGELGDPKAVQYAERAVALAPRSALALDTLGVLLTRKGDVAKGLDYLDRAVKLNADAPQIRLNYAKALIKAGHKDVARKQLEMLREVPGDFAGRPEAESLLKGL